MDRASGIMHTIGAWLIDIALHGVMLFEVAYLIEVFQEDVAID